MKKILLASVGVMVMSARTVYAACIPTPSCSSLGYESSSSCEGGIKCPFGNAWNCTVINKVNEITNKVTEIENKITTMEKEDALRNCAVGHIFYSDKSCSVSLDSSKTPIGVVVYIDGQGHGQVMALKSIGKNQWGSTNVDIPTLTNFSSDESASYDLNSCANTQKIMATGDKSTYPAAWTAHEYKTEGTNAGDWCLPAAGIMTNIKSNILAINNGMTLVGGTSIETTSYYWSSSEQDDNYAWCSDFNSDNGLKHDGDGWSNLKNNRLEVRPVLEF